MDEDKDVAPTVQDDTEPALKLAILPSGAGKAPRVEHHNRFMQVVVGEMAYLYKQEGDGEYHRYGSRPEIPGSSVKFKGRKERPCPLVSIDPRNGGMRKTERRKTRGTRHQ